MNVEKLANAAIMLSITPKWCELILNGNKQIEVRKRPPRLTAPFKCYIYCTKGKEILAVSRHLDKSVFLWKKSDVDRYNSDMVRNGKVVGEFMCKYVEEFGYNSNGYGLKEETRICTLSKIPQIDLYNYLKGQKAYGLHISDVVIYDTPKEITKFKKFVGNDTAASCEVYLSKAPQSWCYVEEQIG